MATTMLNIKTDVKLKKAAQAQAARLGLPLSAILNNYLRTFITERSVVFEETLVPNKKTAKILDQATRDIKRGNSAAFSPAFSNAADAVAWLNA
jgi:addiction module RelB/DinJ family antitoxin